MTYARLLVGDISGNVLTELQAEILSVSWRLNNIGQAVFRIAARDPKATQTNLNFGNKVLIHFENGLPDWGGIIDPPRTWDDGIIEISAYTGEQIFTHRQTSKSRKFTSEPVGSIYEALITEANGISPTGIVIGEISGGDSVDSPSFHLKNLYEAFQKSLVDRMSTSDFDVQPYLEEGQIKLKANFYLARGTDKPGLALVQGANLAAIKLKEQGPIINSWTVAGEGIDWGDNRLIATAQNTDSIGIYGLREGARVLGDVADQGSLNNQAANLVAKSGNPYNIYSLTALDKPPALFAAYDYGDSVRLVAPDYGFGGTDTTVRILSREYVPDAGTCTLVVQEVI